jgi:hypothetical protein
MERTPAISQPGAPGSTIAESARERAWAEFVVRKQEPAVAPVVLHSWLRSRDVFQIDPALKRSPIVLPEDECGQRRERLEALGVGAPVLEMKTYCMWLQTETKRGRRQLQERAKNPPRSDLTATTGKACASSPGGQEQRTFGPISPPSL